MSLVDIELHADGKKCCCDFVVKRNLFELGMKKGTIYIGLAKMPIYHGKFHISSTPNHREFVEPIWKLVKLMETTPS